MKRSNWNIIILLILFVSSFSLSSCSVGILGDYYFVQDNRIQQQLTLNINNKAILKTNKYNENGDIVATDIFKTNWQRFVSTKIDDNGSQIIDENGNKKYTEDIKLLYYENGTNKEIQFHIIGNMLVDYYYNSQYKTFRKFERK